jgi:histidinol-phosphate/aromatic aminotransferase/cobyric acid decarboxylase-like protein
MPQSRRAFLGTAVAGGATFIPFLQARGMEAGTWTQPAFDTNGVIRLNSNENPHGPHRAAVEAITSAYRDINRYTQSNDAILRTAVAKRHGVKEENVLLGAGLVFLCNPNNPTGTAYPHSDVMSFIGEVNRRSPSSRILVDEAYFEYCDLPGYDTLVPLAITDPRIIVARTFSKVFGLAGMRVGYGIAHADTIKKLEPWRLQNSISALSSAAAVVSCDLGDHIKTQQRLNGEARSFALKSLNDEGYKTLPSYTNFVIASIGRDAKKFQEACAKEGVAVGRPFPPLDTHARISIGTMDEMQRAMPTILRLLKA